MREPLRIVDADGIGPVQRTRKHRREMRLHVLQRAGIEREKNFATLNDLCNTMRFGSLCALGGLTPDPVRSVLEHFAEDFEVRA